MASEKKKVGAAAINNAFGGGKAASGLNRSLATNFVDLVYATYDKNMTRT